MYNEVGVEDLHKPAVALINKGFMSDAKSAASGKAMPGFRTVATAIPCECTVEEEIEAGIDADLDDIIQGLTKPLTPEEESPKVKVEVQPRVVFKGNLEEVNRFFYQRGWTDGLPIIPPTEEVVTEMLTGTDLPANHVVTKIIPRLGKATVEKIAINAVMAGALPTYMPVLIAGVQALMDPQVVFEMTSVSTGSWVPFWIINGPIRYDLNVNSGSGAFSPGDIANAAIGRAMGLIIKNIGGIRKGVEDMGICGNPGKYTQVTGENEEQSPWEPLHVGEGFKKEDNTLSLSFPMTFNWVGGIGPSDASGILQTIIYNITSGGMLTIVLPPQHAKALASEGWTKKEIANFICEHGRIPAYRVNIFDKAWLGKSLKPLEPYDTIAVLDSPDMIRIIVAGGPGGTGLLLIQGGRPAELPLRTIKKIELPANWEQLVEKYKGIVPKYIMY